MDQLQSICRDVTQEFSSKEPRDIFKPCEDPVLITRVVGPTESEIGNKERYVVVRVNRFFYNLNNLDSITNWQIKVGGKVVRELRNGHELTLDITEQANAELVEVRPYLVAPTNNVVVKTWVKKSYPARLRALIDGGILDVDGLFAGLCAFYIDRSQRYPDYDDWTVEDDASEILVAMYELFGKRVTTLAQVDQGRWRKVMRHLQSTLKFGGEWDKFQHFIAGAGISASLGETAGWTAAWSAEKIDSFKRIWGDLTGTRQSHQIGFDWADLEWTAAGASFAEIFDDIPNTEGRNILSAFASGKLTLSTVYTPAGLRGGFGELSPVISPGVTTNIDRVDAQIEKMETLVWSHK